MTITDERLAELRAYVDEVDLKADQGITLVVEVGTVVRELVEALEDARKALAWYASHDYVTCTSVDDSMASYSIRDNGARARKALGREG